MYEYHATIVRVIDGDTYDVDLDLGFSIHLHQRVRLNGIDTPEKWTLEGKEVFAYVERLLPPGTRVTTRTERPPADEKYGRYLAEVWTPHGLNVKNHLISIGMGKPYSGGKR